MFLNSFVENTTAFSLEQDIKDQENAVKDSQNKLTTLQKNEKVLAEKNKKKPGRSKESATGFRKSKQNP
jgi:hypothetical protein